jgi:hypothetical protein
MAVPNQGGPVLNKAQFVPYVTGFPLGYWSKAKIPTPKVKVTEVPQAGATQPRKYPSGQVTYDNAEFTGFQDTAGAMEGSLRAWLAQCAGSRTGRAAVPPQAALRDVRVEQTDTDGRVVHEWVLHGCFPVETGDIELEGQDEKPVERKLVLAVTWVEQVT